VHERRDEDLGRRKNLNLKIRRNLRKNTGTSHPSLGRLPDILQKNSPYTLCKSESLFSLYDFARQHSSKQKTTRAPGLKRAVE
jgi:hypothetical protein